MIAVYNLEPKYFNLALAKVRRYYEERNIRVDDYKQLWHHRYDMVFCSSIFTWTNKACVTKDMICGGTGFDLGTRLPHEIEQVNPHKNVGFTTRGCIRHCPWCVVPKMEGGLRKTHELEDIWDGKSKKVTLLDNNILAMPDHFIATCAKAQYHKLELDFEQGLDIRLITHDTAWVLSKTKFGKRIRFAFDDIHDEGIFDYKMRILLQYIKPSRIMVFVLVNYNSTFDQDMKRINIIRGWGADAFVQMYKDKPVPPIIDHLARWTNRYVYKHMVFKDYLEMKGEVAT